MSIPTPLRIVALLTGLVIAGEAVALLIGMRIVGEGDDLWLGAKNDLLLGLDLVTGFGLICAVLIKRGPMTPYAFFAAVSIALLSHLFREWEVFAHAANPFCANTPLFVVNNLKILGLLLTTWLGIRAFW